ncbi:MAG TPA: LytTR family DNA-binding domain-containing protein [Ferruginibacter sp.]|nr:LytTR family DNA-binding domain-containing protein [Ferruginibacter sp.]HPH90214.1 LytTR family DNA-binding domain-containing protein [Ferruginibacter sp.]
MKLIIIEDEGPAAEKLLLSIKACNITTELLAVLGSVQEAVEWFQHHAQPDMIFMDIQLTDGLSFKIFDHVKISCPVIFTTAYDDYWQQAFEYNSIDYLLKPVQQEKLEATFAKYENIKQYFSSHFQSLMQYHQNPAADKIKKRFLVKRGVDYIAVKAEDIAYFYAVHKLVCMMDRNGQKFILDKSLAEIEKDIDPAIFYRANRKYLVNITAIKKIKSYPKSKLQLEVAPPVEEEILISQENVSDFKNWMGS